MDAKYLCGCCSEQYDSANHKPKALPCGHTFCEDCLKQILSKMKICFICHLELGNSSVEEYLTNFALIPIDEEKRVDLTPMQPKCEEQV